MISLIKEMWCDRKKSWLLELGIALIANIALLSFYLISNKMTNNDLMMITLVYGIVFLFFLLIQQVVYSTKVWFSTRYRLSSFRENKLYLANLICSIGMMIASVFSIIIINVINYFILQPKDFFIYEGEPYSLLDSLFVQAGFVIFVTTFLIYASFIVLVANWISSYFPKNFQKLAIVLFIFFSFQFFNLVFGLLGLFSSGMLTSITSFVNGPGSLAIVLIIGDVLMGLVSLYLLKNKIEVKNKQ
ncbi:hypothetical protein [Vagococcus zengguangii]|uniref:Uncharacterized protein n=1 Tax=Vagococcus zengguangii TaxID=2571750 RepID=A0A4D7CNZ7_9ENTE|nr:hypothetical protein [Vagococcus zengguangii]QCI85805.1 hypothetical protein FA707_01970 [Vagococcus zengguangii]TLG81746.1 hypothetical protein FE258_00950 [Vagococcus zengguangii]